MKTLYININGEDIHSTDELIVVGKPDDAIINKFYFELGKEILKGVVSPGISSIKKKDIVTEFRSHDEAAFSKILEQWDVVKDILLGERPTGTITIKLPSEYLSWLQNNSQPLYAEIAKTLYQKGCTVDISIDKIYRNAISVILNNIEANDCKQFVVNDIIVTDDSKITISISSFMNKAIFIPYEDWEDVVSKSTDKQDLEIDGNASSSSSVSVIEFPLDCCFKIDEYLDDDTEAKCAGMPLLGDGLLLIENCSNHKFGYMDEHGEIVIPCSFRDAIPFSGGYAWVQQDNELGKWFVIDNKGCVKNIVPKGYDVKHCNGFHIQLGDNSFYTKKGDLLGANSSRSCDYYSIREDGIVYSRNGHERFLENECKIVETEDFIVNQSNGLYGVVNQVSGKVYIPAEYSKILYLGNYGYYLEKDVRHKYLAVINL